jgi:hypothetical protein
MTSVDAIIRARGGYEHLFENPIRVENGQNGPFMPLSVERIGVGPREGIVIAVHHSREQNGDLIFDPEVVFEVIGDEWHPLSFEQSGVIYWEAVFQDTNTGKLMCRPKLLKDLQKFCRMWDRNIRDQGFVAAATAKAA